MIKILFRPPDYLDLQEEDIAKKFFPVTRSRMDIEQSDLVIGRYSVLPFYKELENDLNKINAKLINSYRQHQYVADLKEWYQDLSDLTPKTYFRLQDIPDNAKQLVIKGQTNSRKDHWLTHMFANNKQEAIQTALRLQEDSLISTQDIYAREYIPLVKYLNGLNGMPVTEEYRFFILNKTVLCGAFYWSNYLEDIGFVPNPDNVSKVFLNKVIDRISDNISFYVLDVAKTQTNEWIVIELNDGQMSGLSANSANILYSRLKEELNDY